MLSFGFCSEPAGVGNLAKLLDKEVLYFITHHPESAIVYPVLALPLTHQKVCYGFLLCVRPMLHPQAKGNIKVGLFMSHKRIFFRFGIQKRP